MLDVGACDGTLLDALARRGREALGLERDAARPGMRAAGLAEVGNAWAAIVFWHPLEHLQDAGADLDRDASMLAAGGVLIIAMPNGGSVHRQPRSAIAGSLSINLATSFICPLRR